MANRKRVTSMETPDVVMEAPPLPPMSWDEQRRLVYDIVNLAPPDVPGVLLLIHGHGTAGMTCTEYPDDGITSWDASADAKRVDRLPQTQSTPTQVDCTFLLDSADQELLHQLREYVDNCYIPHYVPKENCMICEGLWSNGRVIACGNDDCDTRIHEECFGTILRENSDGPWLCPTCLLGRQLNCAVCMQSGGALKPLAAGSNTKDASDDQKWVHVLCALAIPELTMRDVPTLEPVDGFDEIENGRFRYLCGICRKRGGASIICEQENCNVGMHPICAANAGFMIGTEAKPLGAYCEKHLPTSRIAHAKRWISDVDLVEEIMSENSVIEDGDEVMGHGLERFSFILESTPGLHAQNKLLGPASALRWGALPRYSTRPDRKSNAFENVKVNANAWTVPGMVVMGLKTQKPLVFPPQDQDRVGLPVFPQGDDLVGAVVDYLVKDQDEWCRAQVVEWDAGRGLHLLQLIANSQKLWARLGSSNTQILYLMDEDTELDGPRIKLYRPVRRGVSEWRPKPRKFASASSS
ncbi:hypothetical protein Poli38472_009242 [Pythium oligandrum]|uniref:PHD-type domain-containing protein n=1 Tax=Pythium oligandrum TaxID=41045 RepID=A0A8K1CLZ3_PYTOL|nr:hypothetical protein Poli38472_009242 [Pythium oligandrum]|eukprot:TMW65075.1 hypothetical protein Poli38472_009242 [Pythium oligandrum]